MFYVCLFVMNLHPEMLLQLEIGEETEINKESNKDPEEDHTTEEVKGN